MASPTQWTWVSVNSGSWWWTERPGVLQSMGSQRVSHTTEQLNNKGDKKELLLDLCPSSWTKCSLCPHCLTMTFLTKLRACDWGKQVSRHPKQPLCLWSGHILYPEHLLKTQISNSDLSTISSIKISLVIELSNLFIYHLQNSIQGLTSRFSWIFGLFCFFLFSFSNHSWQNILAWCHRSWKIQL